MPLGVPADGVLGKGSRNSISPPALALMDMAFPFNPDALAEY